MLRLRSRLRAHIVKRRRTVDTVTSTIHHDHTKLRSPGQPVNSFVFLNAANINGARLTGTLTRCLFSSRGVVAHVSVDRCRRGFDTAHLVNTPPKCINCSRNNRLARTVHHGPCSIILFSRVRGTRPSMFGVLLRILSSKQLASGGKHIIGFGGAVVVVADGVKSSLVHRGFRGVAPRARSGIISRAGIRILRLLGGAVHPRFLGHVSSVVVFAPLGRRRVHGVIVIRLGDIGGVLTRGKVTLRFASTTLAFVSSGKFSPRFNTHPMGHIVRGCILGRLSGRLLNKGVGGSHPVAVSDGNTNLIFGG